LDVRRLTPFLSACAFVVVVGANVAVAASSVTQTPVAGVRHVPVPLGARPVDTSHPTRVVGHGTAASCTSAAVVAAVRAGGIIRFSCGLRPVTIRMDATAKVLNTSPQVVLDGGGLVTLSGEGRRRILYMDTCDPAQVWTTPHCQDQSSPELVVQNLTFEDGNSTGETFDGGGGGAIFARGGRLRIVNAAFSANRCDPDGPDIGGGAVRALSQYDGLPVFVVDSRFTGNECSNGGALSSIGVSWTVLNSRFLSNRAIGTGANPAQPGTPGGGSGGAIYNDGDDMRLSIGGSTFVDNHANEGGGAIFFVSDDRTGTLAIASSNLTRNPNAGFQTAGLPGIFFLGAHSPTITASILR
jgi:Chlamydia polymorphic membrane protein (Chlamydia_PMP) repeat